MQVQIFSFFSWKMSVDEGSHSILADRWYFGHHEDI